MQAEGELAVPLLGVEEAEETEQEHQEIGSAGPDEVGAQQQQGDVEQGFPAAGSEDGASSKAEDAVALETARAVHLTGPAIYLCDLVRLCIFYWAIVSDALLLKELYVGQHSVLAGISTGFTVGPHVFMSLLLIVRQGWLQAASQAVGFILTLNPFENLTPIPQGIVGLFVLSIGFIAYVLIAASGLIFVAYCVVCYLVTALLFSLLILDLAALVITVAPSKAIFKYTDLVYTENFKTSRLIFQAWLQSAPELVVIGVILYNTCTAKAGTVLVPWPILLQAAGAHVLNLLDKTLLFRSCVGQSGCSTGRQLLLLLAIRSSCRLSLPVLKENLSRVVRRGGGEGGAAAGQQEATALHLSSAEEVDGDDGESAASMVPEYLTPNNGGLLSPGQLMGLSHAVFLRHGGPHVAELVLEVTPDVMVGKLLADALPAVPNVVRVRLVNAGARGADAGVLTRALLQLSGLRTLQLHEVVVDERGAAALSRLLEATPTLQQLELCRCKLQRRAAVALTGGLRLNRTLRQLNLAGVRGLDEAGAVALADAVCGSKVLAGLNLAFVKLSDKSVEALVQAVRGSSSLHVVAVSQGCLSVEAGHQLVSAISALTHPKAPPSLTCNLNLGTFPVEGLDGKVQFLVVGGQDDLIMDAWQGLAGPLGLEEGIAAGPVPHHGSATATAAAAAVAVAGEGSTEADAELEAVPLLQQQQQQHYQQQQQQQRPSQQQRLLRQQQHSAPAAAFGVVTPPTGVTPPGSPRAAAAAAAGGSSSALAGITALLPRATAAWVCSMGSSAGGHSSPSAPSTTPLQRSGSNGGGASSSKGTDAGRCPSLLCPCLVFVVEQGDCTACMVQSPLLFEELDTLDLAGLGIEDEGAAGMAKTLALNPNLRRCVLADNKIGEEGGAALAEALAVNTRLQVLDLSANEFSAEGVAVMADAARTAAGLRQLRLLGNKIPFGLTTLRRLMQAEASNPACRLVLVEDPAEVLEALEADGDSSTARRAADFYSRQQQYRTQRRARQAARQQRLAQLEQQAAATAAAQEQQQQQDEVVLTVDQEPSAAAAAAAAGQLGYSGAAWMAADTGSGRPGGGVRQAGGSSGEFIAPQASGSSIASLDGQPLRVVVHPGTNGSSSSSASGPCQAVTNTQGAVITAGVTAAASGDNTAGLSAAAAAAGGAVVSRSPHGSGSLCSVSSEEDTCGICFDERVHVAIKYCGHRLCVDCYRKVWELSGGDATCPFCRARLEGYAYLDWPLE